jgi:hypothetical protein
VDDKKSTASYVFNLVTGAVSWINKKQHADSLSSTKAKYRLTVQGTWEVVWLWRVFADLQVV